MRTLGLISASLLLSLLIACGGSHPEPANPTFTSVPVTAASEGAVYSYQLTATDPSGGTVTFSLNQAPAGATLAGSTISWTPSASQARSSNAFTAKATTTSGGSATQSWTVTPTGTVTVTWIATFWTPTGPIQVPRATAYPPFALVPQGDGSLALLPGTTISPGVFTIADVPGGHYWLMMGLPPGLPPIGFWTSASRFDLGRDVSGSPNAVGTPQPTTFQFNLSGLDPSLPPGVVSFIPGPINLTPDPGATTLDTSVSVSSILNWTQVTTAYLVQDEPVSLGPLENLVLGPELSLSNLAFTNGGTNTVTGTLTPSPTASLNLSIPGSKWAPLLQNVGPSPATPSGSWLSVSVEPYVTGINTSPSISGTGLYMVQPNPGNGVGFPGAVCPGTPFFGFGMSNPPIITDQNLGILEYGDPFPPDWTRVLAFCEAVDVAIPVGNLSFPIPLSSGVAVAPSDSPLAPITGPVVNPTINGSNLFTTGAVNTTVETLNWSAPSGLAPYGYTVYVLQLIPIQNGLEILNAGAYSTAQTSVTLPPVTSGNTYLFVIVAQVDGIANMEASPYRSQLPTAFATVMSDEITVSAAAARPALYGDRKQWERILHPGGERHRIMALHR